VRAIYPPRGCYIGMGPVRRDCPWWAWPVVIVAIIAAIAMQEWL
jgi:hypothetical protein